MNRHLRFEIQNTRIPIEDLARFAKAWILDGQYRRLSNRTLEIRSIVTDRFLWWLRRDNAEECGAQEVKGFLSHVSNGHLEPGGRYGIPRLKTPVRPRTVNDSFSVLRAFFHFLAEEGIIEVSPIEGMKGPVFRSDQIQPFDENQVNSLWQAAKKGPNGERNYALLLFMLDTGVRASELCNLDRKDVDVVNRKAVVLGKGNKHRPVFFGRTTSRGLWKYIRETGGGLSRPLFETQRGERFRPNSLLLIFRKLAMKAGIQAVRCSPHTVRHTFAILFLRNGGNPFTRKELLGHTNLAMTNRYVALAQADIQNQHALFSPVEALKSR